jgi:hypothetical protein
MGVRALIDVPTLCELLFRSSILARGFLLETY